jgi:hypothetical protein
MSRPPLAIPEILAPLIQQPRWVLWKWKKGKNGKWTKPPYQGQSPNIHANCSKPETWCGFETVTKVYCEGSGNGIGFALLGSGIGAFDIDDCRDSVTGKLDPWADDLVRRCGSYCEITPSGKGIRIIGRTSGPKVQRKFPAPNANGVSVEFYRDCERFITVSGNQVGNAGLADIDAPFDELLAELAGKKKEKTESKSENRSENKKHDLKSLIKNGCGTDFGGDRSRAVWYVINQLIKSGHDRNYIVAVLLDRANGISAHIYDQSKPADYARRQVEKAQKENGDDGFENEIKRLTKLSPLQYARERAAIADRFGIGVAVLDKLVNAERRKDDDGKQGRAISFPEREAWPEPVDGAELLDEIATAIRHHVVLFDQCRDTAALWATHTYLLNQFLISPRLAIRSPIKQCGKTTLLDVLEHLVFKPLTSGSLTSAVVFRVVEAYRPTLLVDEADTFLHDNEELRGVLNTGHRASGSVTRNVPVGDSYEPRQFSTFSAVAIAAIGNLPDTLHDRSVVIDLKRRLPSETIAPFYADRTAHLDVLARKAARWCHDHAEQIKAVDGPELLPPGIYNREGDNWRPLLAIAQVASGDWPDRARKAAEAASVTTEDESRLALLLGDIRSIFVERGSPKRLRSADLVADLRAIEGRPWAEYGKARKPISQNQLARLLKPLGIAPEVFRDEEATPRGYVLEHFSDAFDRYLPSQGGLQPQQCNKCDEQRTSEPFQTATSESNVAVGKCEKSNDDGDCCGVAVEKEEIGKNAIDGGCWPPVCEHCGIPERPGNPVHPYAKGGQTYLLHPACWTEWLAGPDPDGWSFNLDNGP